MKRAHETAMSPKTASTSETSSAALWVVLARAYRSMGAFVERSVASLDIGLSDFMILEALLHKGPLTMSELCEAALITNKRGVLGLSQAVDNLTYPQPIGRIFCKSYQFSDTQGKIH